MNLSQKGVAPLIILVIIAAIVGTGIIGYQVYRSNNAVPQKASQKGQSNKTALKKIEAPPRSKAPGIISAAITAHGYNPKTGAAIKPDKYFSPKDKQLFLLLNVNKAKVGTHIEYVRYLQGKYLDHRSIKITQPNWKYAYFSWTNKPGREHKKGVYRVRIYSNGVLEKKVNYLVRTQ